MANNVLRKQTQKSESCIEDYDRFSMDRNAIIEQKIVVVIPTLNEEEGIGRVIEGINEALKSYKYEVLIVDGHSTDRTIQKGKDMGATVFFQEKRGYGDALRTGLQAAKKTLDAEILVIIDADGTYAPEEIPSLLTPISKDHCDLVVGNRFLRMTDGAMTQVNKAGNKILSLLARKILQLDITDTQSGMRALRSNLIGKLQLHSDGMPFALELLASAKQVGARIQEIPISYHPRIGRTKLNPITDGIQILLTIFRLALSSRRNALA